MSAASHAGPGATPVKGLPELSGIDVKPGTRVAIVRTRWNAAVVDALAAGARAELMRHGVESCNITEKTVSAGRAAPLQRRVFGAGAGACRLGMSDTTLPHWDWPAGTGTG